VKRKEKERTRGTFSNGKKRKERFLFFISNMHTQPHRGRKDGGERARERERERERGRRREEEEQEKEGEDWKKKEIQSKSLLAFYFPASKIIQLHNSP